MGSLKTSDLKRICVVGAGVTGLVAIKYLNQHEGLIGTVFEQMDRVSGLWHYVEDPEKDVNGLPIHSALYPSLRFNLPKELTQFTDFPFPDYEDGASYLRHYDVKNYLNAFADKFDLRKNIQLNTKVLSIRPTVTTQSSDDFGDLKTKWSVEVFNYKTNVKKVHIFDGVLVANGKFSEPIIPEIQGMAEFKGSVLHTKFYRHPDSFKDQHVVLLGFGFSALDIAFEIADYAKKVTILHRKPFVPATKKLIIVSSNIDYMTETGVVLKNGDKLLCDSLILATGYKIVYPFLHEDCGITVEDEKYVGLYRHIHSPKYPSLCFSNIFNFSPAWRVAEVQVHYTAKYFQGQVHVPPEAERRRVIKSQEANWNSKNVPVRHRLRLTGDVYPYLESLDKASGGISERTRNLVLFRTCLLVGVGRLYAHPEFFRKDRLSWINNSNTATFYCYPDPAGVAEAELLTLELDESTGKVHITSSLGEIQNKPFSY